MHSGHVDIQYQQGNGNGYDAIAEGFNAACPTIIVGLSHGLCVHKASFHRCFKIPNLAQTSSSQGQTDSPASLLFSRDVAEISGRRRARSLIGRSRENDESAVVWRLLLPGRFDLGEWDRLGLNTQCTTGRLCYEPGHHFSESLDLGAPQAASRDQQS